jgi:hypothetical protein
MSCKKISSFFEIKFNPSSNPLVICDIDYTFIKPYFNLEHYYNIVKIDNDNSLFLKLSDDELRDEAMALMIKTYDNGFVKQTDPNGFAHMLSIIKSLNGKLIFLTARGLCSHETTVYELANAGLKNAWTYDIHYTANSISKGEYIKKNIRTNEFSHVYFIDDNPDFLESVKNLCPEINCYMFNITL